MLAPQRFVIGEGSHVNQGCFIDARGGVRIGNGVSVSHYVKIVTGTHDIMSRRFDGAFRPVKIGDHVWIGIGATILPGVTIGDGAVVAAGSVVVHDVDRYCVVGGVPARKIKSRTDVLEYECESAIKWL